MNNKNIFTRNNFDLLRLFAAFQVVLHHSTTHLGVKFENSILWDIFVVIPGVPIFFFISGYLISKSYESNSCIKEYSQNRILRIYPALFVCVLLSVLSVYFFGYFQSVDVPRPEFIIWLIGQLSFYQFYNPEFMREYGSGVLNGSLWTISVELQFYVLVPMLYFLLKKLKNIKIDIVIFVLMLVFLLFNRLYYAFHDDYKDLVLYKLFGVTFIPWFYMFLCGVLVQRNFEYFYRLLSNRFLVFFLVFSFYLWFIKSTFSVVTGNNIGPFVFFPLVLVLFSFAYTSVSLSKFFLNKNDISYGLYIYHMPIINAVLYFGYKGSAMYMGIAIFLTFVAAFLSWKLVEYPSLKLKRHPLNPLYKK